MLIALRILVGVLALLMLLAGSAVLVMGGAGALRGLWLLVVGAGGLVAVAFERLRYNSEAAERSGDAPGQAGIDSEPLDPRFRATEERFVDPTTRRQLRVWMDPESGERRYRADE